MKTPLSNKLLQAENERLQAENDSLIAENDRLKEQAKKWKRDRSCRLEDIRRLQNRVNLFVEMDKQKNETL